MIICASTHPPAAHPSATPQDAPAARLACDEARTTRMGGEDPPHRKFYNVDQCTQTYGIDVRKEDSFNDRPK
ncbi:MAG: hypothetical protein GWP10_11450 [Nitrospiraceae bacterium]|nr:hypothetical protein [Nitrospiraceae bacterium]